MTTESPAHDITVPPSRRPFTLAEDLYIIDNWHMGLDWLAGALSRTRASVGTRKARMCKDLTLPYSLRKRAQALPLSPRSDRPDVQVSLDLQRRGLTKA
jgi:hypothetical protein